MDKENLKEYLSKQYALFPSEIEMISELCTISQWRDKDFIDFLTWRFLNDLRRANAINYLRQYKFTDSEIGEILRECRGGGYNKECIEEGIQKKHRQAPSRGSALGEKYPPWQT